MQIIYQPIGIIHSPFTSLHGMPIQPTAETAAPGTVELYPEFEEGMQDLDGFSHIMLFYHFHCSSGFELTVTPYLDTVKRGMFATRAPRRPNPIGLSVVRLTAIEGPLVREADLQRFFRALKRAEQFLAKHQSEAVAMLSKETGLTPEMTRRAMQRHSYRLQLDQLTISSLEQTAAFLHEQKKIKQVPKFAEVTDKRCITSPKNTGK